MKKAIIYVRGHNQEMQEVFCRGYAADQGYKVMFVTTDIEAVNNCDVLLVSNVSRISRDKFKYYEIINKLKPKGIVIECAINHDKAVENISLTRGILN